MIIGHCEIIDKFDDEVIVKVGKEYIAIHPNDTIDALLDPFPESSQPGAYIYKEIQFEELCNNIEKDGDEYLFIDDLMYIGGIAKY